MSDVGEIILGIILIASVAVVILAMVFHDKEDAKIDSHNEE